MWGGAGVLFLTRGVLDLERERDGEAGDVLRHIDGVLIMGGISHGGATHSKFNGLQYNLIIQVLSHSQQLQVVRMTERRHGLTSCRPTHCRNASPPEPRSVRPPLERGGTVCMNEHGFSPVSGRSHIFVRGNTTIKSFLIGVLTH
jgi:hypothetical protein